MPSADPVADERFRERRVAQLRRRRGRRGVHWSTWVIVAIVLLTAAVVAGSRSQPDDRVATQSAKVGKPSAIAGRQGGTGCVGWPLSLTPSTTPSASEPGVLVWGDREAFHVRNVADRPVEVQVTAAGGAVRPMGQDAQQVADDTLRFRLADGAEGRFTAACGVDELTLATGPGAGTVPFLFGTGPEDSPVTVTKVVR